MDLGNISENISEQEVIKPMAVLRHATPQYLPEVPVQKPEIMVTTRDNIMPPLSALPTLKACCAQISQGRINDRHSDNTEYS